MSFLSQIIVVRNKSECQCSFPASCLLERQIIKLINNHASDFECNNGGLLLYQGLLNALMEMMEEEEILDENIQEFLNEDLALARKGLADVATLRTSQVTTF